MHAHAHMHCLVGACSRACSELRSGQYTNRLARSASPCMSLAPHRLAPLAETFMCITPCTDALPRWQCSLCTVPLLHACSFMCITCTVRACTCTCALPRWQCTSAPCLCCTRARSCASHAQCVHAHAHVRCLVVVVLFVHRAFAAHVLIHVHHMHSACMHVHIYTAESAHDAIIAAACAM